MCGLFLKLLRNSIKNTSWKRPQYYNCPQLKINNQRVGRLPTLCIIYLRLLKIQVKRTDTDGLRFSVAEYSEEEQRDIVDVLKTFTGSIVDKSPEEYAAYLKDKGVEIPADDAFLFAQEAARQKLRQARKAADQRRDNWLYEKMGGRVRRKFGF